MSFFKSNKTNTTAATTETTATEENTNKGGGLLTTLAVAGGTIIGITAAVIGGKKVYKHFHDDNETIDSSDDATEEDFEEDDFCEVPVEDEESEAEELENPETAKAEESKADVTENNVTVKAEEAKAEETKKPEPSKKEAAPLVEKMGECLKVFDRKMLNPLEIKLTINHVDDLIGRIASCHRTIGDNCKIETFINKLNKGLEKFWVEMYGEIIEYKSRNEDVQAIFDDPIRMVDYAYNNMHYINRNTTVVDASAETIKLYKGLVAKAEKPAETSKPSVDETKTTENCFDVFKDGHKESNKVEGETKTSTKSSDENQKLIDSIELVMDEIPVLHPERCDLRYLIRCMGGYIHKLNKDSLNKEELDQLRGYCADMTSYANKAIRNISRDKITDVDGIYDALGGIKMIADEFVASDILEYTYTPNVEKRSFNNRYKAACERLNDARKKMTAGETKTAKKASTETQVDASKVTTGENQTVEESPSETQIGNSTVISDDGETVTLTAEVSQESINNVNDVINIVSVIPDREHPETNDLPYFIRVIGDRIRGIKEPEATFVAYDDASKSNKFMDACVDICDMAGKAICNLANSGKDPLASMQWIDKCTNELVASGIIDNTYDPNTYRAAILKAHKEAMDVLSKLVSGETKTDTNEKVIDKIDTVLNEIGSMAEKHFENVSVDTLVSKMFEVNNALPELDDSNRSKATKRIAENKINITISAFCKLRQDEANTCEDITKVPMLISDVNRMRTLTLSNVEITNITLIAISKAFSTACNKAEELGTKASDETQTDAKSSDETQAEDTLTYTMSEKIQEAVQQSDETAVTVAPEPDSQAPMSPEASSLASKLQEVGALMRAEKWSDAAEFYKTQLTPYLADDGLSKELRNEIMGIKTKATNMLMSRKQLEAKQKAASAKASKKGGKRRRRH